MCVEVIVCYIIDVFFETQCISQPHQIHVFLYFQLKLIDRLRVTCWMPPDYWQTDNWNGLVMVIHNYDWLNSASRVLISTCSAPMIQTGERKQFSLFDLDLWHTTLTYNPRLAKVKVDPHAKNQGQKVQTGECPQSNGHSRIHTDVTKRIISPATWLIKK